MKPLCPKPQLCECEHVQIADVLEFGAPIHRYLSTRYCAFINRLLSVLSMIKVSLTCSRSFSVLYLALSNSRRILTKSTVAYAPLSTPSDSSTTGKMLCRDRFEGSIITGANSSRMAYRSSANGSASSSSSKPGADPYRFNFSSRIQASAAASTPFSMPQARPLIGGFPARIANRLTPDRSERKPLSRPVDNPLGEADPEGEALR